MIGVVDLRLLGFYKIKQEVLQEHLGKHYHFESAEDICNLYNRFVNLMRKEEKNSKGKYPWLEDTDKRKIYNRQRDFRQVYKFGQLIFDLSGKDTG